MESLSKNKQTEANISKMTEKVFAPLEMKSCHELTEGYFNAAYEVELSNGAELCGMTYIL